MSKFIYKVLSLFFLFIFGKASIAQSIENKKISGFSPIWFELNQKYEYGTSFNGTKEFVSVVKRSDVIAFQFHPEKSGLTGLNLLKASTKNFFS